VLIFCGIYHSLHLGSDGYSASKRDEASSLSFLLQWLAIATEGVQVVHYFSRRRGQVPAAFPRVA
jgi:hypothetical protein